MLNILYISHERKMGGANRSLFELTKEMKNKGHNVSVVVLHKNCPIDINLRETGINTFPCFFGWWVEPDYWNGILKYGFRLLHVLQFGAVNKISKYVKENNIDIIHSNSSCIDIGTLVAKKTRVKHVWHFREYGEEDYNLVYMAGRQASMEKVNRDTDKVIFISRALRESYGSLISDEKAEVVYNGISTNYKSKEKTYNSVLTFLISGNLNVNKNQMLVLKAVEVLRQRGVTNFQVKIAGECTSLKQSKKYKEQLLNYIKEHNLTNVELLGYVEDMKKLREETDVEIVASVSEAFGRVTVEGMFSRNPVLVSDAGANPELVEPGTTGLIFKNRDAEDLAEKMNYLIETPQMVRDMGENAYHYAIENFTIQKNADNIEKIYESIMYQ